MRSACAVRELITTGDHEIRNELTAKMVSVPSAEGILQRDLAVQLRHGTSSPTKRALQASIDYETAATALDHVFRRFLNHTTQQDRALITREQALQTPGLADLSSRIGDLVQRAIASVSQLENGLAHDTAHDFMLFDRRLTPDQLFEALLERHEQVQAGKGKLSWLDQLSEDWTVRVPYRNQPAVLDDEVWTHPMRLTTLARFLSETA